jgi:hypothetical protein
LLAELGLLVLDVVVVVRRVSLALLRGKLVGNRTLVLGVQVLMAALLALVVTLRLVGGLGRVALVACFIESGAADVGLTSSVHTRHIDIVDEESGELKISSEKSSEG